MFVCDIADVMTGCAIGSALEEGSGFKAATDCRGATDDAELFDGWGDILLMTRSDAKPDGKRHTCL